MTLFPRRCPYCNGKSIEAQRTYTIQCGEPRHWFRLLQINLCSAFKPLFESRRSHGARSHGPEFLKPLPGLDVS
jgi:hypothetical protein